MIKDNKGQISLEYLLIFTISLILLIIFTMPLAEMTIEDTFDVSDTLKIKSDLLKISEAVREVYGEGQGSKITVNILSSKSFNINIDNKLISTNLKLHDGSNKKITIKYNSKLYKSNIYIKKGQNTIIIEWPVNSKNMKIYKK